MEIISVLLCTYNEPLKYLKLSIESILSQTYTNIQLIIVNDNPKRADMADLLAAYAREDSRIKYIVNPSNIGLVSSLNAGLKDAIGEYIARMDADDIATKDRLEKQLEFLQVKSYDMVGCNAIKIDENGKEIGYLNVPTAHEKIKEYQLYAGYLGLLLFSVQHYGLTGVIATYLLQALAVVFIKEVIMRKRNYQELM